MGKTSFSSAHLAQLGDAAGVNPLGNEDIAGAIKARVVRMEELAGDPTLALLVATKFHAVLEHLLAPLGVFA